MELKGKVALVTGASRGIGAAIAVALAKKGARVVINFSSDKSGADKVLTECNKYSRDNAVIQADVASDEEVRKLIDEVKRKYGRLDVVVNNAGIYSDVEDDAVRSFKEMFEVNFFGLIRVCEAARKLMKQGKIVNVSSIYGTAGYGPYEASAYSSSKAAVESYTKSLAKKLAPEVLVNAVAPGRVVTGMWGNPNEQEQKELGKAHLIERMIFPEEVADVVMFLLQSDAICGEVVRVDGGMSLVGT